MARRKKPTDPQDMASIAERRAERARNAQEINRLTKEDDVTVNVDARTDQLVVDDMTPDELPADMEARTPAPEGEAWRTIPVEPTEAMIAAANALWGDGTGVNYVQLEPEDFYAAMLAASPVVPVGVSREEIADWICETPCRPGCSSWQGAASRNRCDCDRDAILAALRPTDTGWRDIATAPRDGRVVLVFSAARCVWSVVSAQWRQDWPNGGWDTISKHTTPIVPTHWMPLPPAPTDTGRE